MTSEYLERPLRSVAEMRRLLQEQVDHAEEMAFLNILHPGPAYARWSSIALGYRNALAALGED